MLELELLDRRVLNLLIQRQLARPDTAFGLSVAKILRGLRLRPTRKNVGAVRSALRILERKGLAYSIKRSPARWFPSSRAVAEHGAFGQRRIEDYWRA